MNSPDGAGNRPVLPLSAGAEHVFRDALAALADPARRRLPEQAPAFQTLARTLDLLADPDYLRAAAEARGLRGRRSLDPRRLDAELRARRRNLFRDLRPRHGELLAALGRALGEPAPVRERGRNFIVVTVFTFLVVFTVGAHGGSENPFLDLADGP